MLAIAAGLTLGCSNDEPQETVASVSLAQSGQGSFLALNTVLNEKIALSATEWLDIGDRAIVLDGSLAGGVSNSGTGIVRVGSDARVGSVWTKGSVDLRDRATVTGAVHVASIGNVQRGNQVNISSGIQLGELGTSTDIYDGPPEYPLNGGDIRLEPGQTEVVEPGHYGELAVKSNSKLFLLAGDYSFSRVHIETGGKVMLPRQCALSRLRVREAFFFRGEIVQTGADDALRLAIAYDGSQTAHVEASASGAIIAPEAELILSSHKHEGRFFARRLRVQSNAEIVGTGMVQCDTSDDASSVPPTFVAATLGPAPGLTGPEDLDAFLTWFYRIRKSEVEEARGAIFSVTNNDDVLNAALARFEEARANRNFGKALMLLAFVGVMKTPNAEAALVDLLNQPIAYTAQPDERGTLYHDEVEYRRTAIFNLNSRATSTARAAIEAAAFGHADRNIRSAGVRALAYGASADQLTALKSQVQPGDEFFVDRPNRSDPDFAARYLAMQQHYTQE